jgi:hypothetical protein
MAIDFGVPGASTSVLTVSPALLYRVAQADDVPVTVYVGAGVSLTRSS